MTILLAMLDIKIVLNKALCVVSTATTLPKYFESRNAFSLPKKRLVRVAKLYHINQITPLALQLPPPLQPLLRCCRRKVLGQKHWTCQSSVLNAY